MSVNKKSYIIQRERLAKIIKAESNYKKTPKERLTQGYIETRLETVEELWKEFNEEHYSIHASASEEEIASQEYFTKGIYDIFEDKYVQYKGCLREILRGMIIPEKAQTSSESQPVVKKPQSSEVKLPKIELPKFSGKYEDWQQYFDLFTSLIDKNTNLSAVEKLHYLKSTLSGEAEILIRNLPTTELNYDAAWKKLKARYNNKRYNVNMMLKRLFSQKQITSESAQAIRSLLDTTTSCVTSITNLGIETKQWDVILIFLVVSKLDNESLRQWEINISGISSDALPTWSDLVLFLESRFRTLEMIDSGKQIYNSKAPQYKRTEKVKSFAAVQNNTTKYQCIMCSGDHILYQCKSFGQLTPRERQEFAHTKSLCYNCLAPTHSVKNCRYSTICRRCGRRHHTLLHQEREIQQGLTSKPENNHAHTQSQRSNQENIQHSSPDPGVNVVANFAKEETAIGSADVLLATAIVKAYSFSGKFCLLRALIDQGSQASFVTEETVQTLGLMRIPVSGCASGVGDGRLRIKHMVSFRIESRRDPSKYIQISAYVLKSLISRLPTNKTSSPDWSDIENLSLADPGYTSPGRIDVLLGAEVYGEVLLSDIIKHPREHLLAQNTIFGWIISGKVSKGPTDVTKMVSLNIQVKEDFLLKQFWELENEPNSIQKKFSKMEEKCEEFFDSTTTRNKEGRFVVRLPFNSEDPECQYRGLKEIAQKRFYHLEKKFHKNPKFKEEYSKVMQEYLDLNHMIKIKDEIIHPKAVYFPHHAVVREDKETTKLRVVFDASCKGVNGVSLNDNLLVGPKLQQDLRHILMRWRRFPVCIVADIIKMYRQVRVHDEDTRFQRILWRFNPDEPLGQYELLTLTFGTACAPHLAVKSLQRLAVDEHLNYPTASEITKRDFYVDDLMTCCQTEEEAIEIYTEMNKLMNAGGFQLQKWSTNSKALLQFIGQDNQKAASSIPIKADNMVKVLGICWNRDSDEFQYTVELPEVNKSPTKRQVLSDIARLYDPMGWIAPVVLTAKVFIQKLWKSGLSWDDELPEDLEREWLTYRSELAELKTIFIPRWLHFTGIHHSERNERFSIKLCQKGTASEIQRRNHATKVPKKNALHALNPFLDEMGLLRVGGRIVLSKLSYDEKHPLIMPEISHLTQVIIEDAHSTTMHGGPQAMLNFIRGKFCIIHARQLVKRYFRRCVTCIRYSQRKVTPLMGQLPEVRLQPSKVFKSSGVDYAGPINLRFSPGRGAKSYKGYICLFVCMVTRAIHIEAVSDLTSKGFIAAFRRFVGRRGRCTDLHCDNGTNFVGADKVLREIFDLTKSKIPEEIAEVLSMEGTKFHYIPPLSPNFGGIWEAGVRSVKTHLKKVIGDHTLTYEEMTTVLVQIEACLNSRPLSQLGDHAVDPLPLTPGHFLVGEPLVNVCDDYFTDKTENVNLTSRWKLVQKMTNNFWHRWSKDYLLNLDKRYKWTTKKSEPDVDDVVIVRDDNLPPTKWILGRITQKHPGKDNITRVVTIKCKDKLLKRPINKLCFLPK